MAILVEWRVSLKLCCAFFYYTTSLQLVTALSNCTAQIGGSDWSVFLSAPETFGVSNACHAHSRTSDLARLFSTNVSVRTAHFNIKALPSFPMGISLFILNRVCTSFMNHYYYVGNSLYLTGVPSWMKSRKKKRKRTCRNHSKNSLIKITICLPAFCRGFQTGFWYFS
jgi:hypothetical protein